MFETSPITHHCNVKRIPYHAILDLELYLNIGETTRTIAVYSVFTHTGSADLNKWNCVHGVNNDTRMCIGQMYGCVSVVLNAHANTSHCRQNARATYYLQ